MEGLDKMAQVPAAWPVYRIIRFRRGSTNRTTRTGLTLEEAQAHCSSEKTHGPGWFDGYDYIKGFKLPEEVN